MARKFKRIYPHLRLSAVLQKLIPEAEVSHLIDILVQQSDTLTNVTRKIIKYDLCVNVRTLFAIRNLFNLKDKDTRSPPATRRKQDS